MTDGLRVWLLSDGVPGHLNQARGLAYWMAKHEPLHVVEVPLRLRARTLSRRILPVWIKRSMDPLRALEWAYDVGYPADAATTQVAYTIFLFPITA